MSSSQFDLPDVFELFGVQNAVADDGGGGGSNSNLLNSQLRDNSAAKNAASAAPGLWSDNAGDCWAEFFPNEAPHQGYSPSSNSQSSSSSAQAAPNEAPLMYADSRSSSRSYSSSSSDGSVGGSSGTATPQNGTNDEIPDFSVLLGEQVEDARHIADSNNLLGITNMMERFNQSRSSYLQPEQEQGQDVVVPLSVVPGADIARELLLASEKSETVAQAEESISSALGGVKEEDLTAGAEATFPPAPPGKCDVCGADAGKHTYYGGKVCPGCRAFFRRAVQSRYCDIFTCAKKDGMCEINVATRRDCQYCRYRKCLACGMKPSWVLSDSERDRRFNKRRKYYGGSGGSEETASTPTERPPCRQKATTPREASTTALATMRAQPVMEIAIEDWNVIEKVHSYTKSAAHKCFHEYLLGNPGFFRDLSALGYFGGTAGTDLYKSFGGMYQRFAEEFFLNLDEFPTLPMSDRRKLVEANGAALSRFKSAINLLEMKSCLTQRIAADTKSGLYPALRGIAEDLERLNIKDRKPQLSYGMFYNSPWAANYTDEIRHFDLMRKMKQWPRDSESKPVDGIQVTLMKLLIAFNTDAAPDLERPDLVHRVQSRYAYLLQRYLKFKYRRGDAGARFNEGLRMASYAREAVEIQKSRISLD